MARRRLTPAQATYLAPGTPGPDGDPATSTLPQQMPPIARVAEDAAGTAAARQLAEEIKTAKDEGRMVIQVPLADVSPAYLLRDRIVLGREEIEALKTSIRDHGQRVPAEITPLTAPQEPSEAGVDALGPPHRPWGLISGWRRLQALNELFSETQDPQFSKLRALVRLSEDAGDSYVAMVEENELRVGLSYYERARLVSETTAQGVFPDRNAALRALFGTASRAKRSKIGSFVDLHMKLGDLLSFPTEIPERLGLMLVAGLREGREEAIRHGLRNARPADASAELALLNDLIKPPRAGVSRAKHPGEVLRPGVEMTTLRKGSRLTLTLSGDGVDDALLEKVRRALR